MTNKKKILLPIFICLFALSLAFSIFAVSFADASVQFSYELQSEYTKGITVTLPQAEANGTILKHTLTYPDGRSTTYEKVTFDQSGEYTLVYYVDNQNENGAIAKTFVVKDSFSGLFTCSDGVEIVGEMELPEYINVEGNTVDGSGVTPAEWYGHTSGVKFKATKKGATIDYNGIIDLKKLGNTYSTSVDGWWNSLDTSFIEFLVTPEDNTKRELNYLEITLTDVYDPANYLLIDITATDAGISTSMASCYIAAAPKGLYDTIGKPASSLQGEMGPHGTSTRSSFYGQVGTVDTDSIRLFFDTNRNALWANPVTPARYPRPIFEKFDDPTLVGLENLWYGFTTGEVYLTMKVGSMTAQEASFMILSIDGQNMDSDYQIGNHQSEIIIDYGEYQGKELPYGVAGENTNYPVFEAIAFNKTGGILNKPNVNVYYGGEDGSLRQPILIANDRFKTELAGKYHIVYTSQTAYGKATKTVTVDVLSEYNAEDQLVLTLSNKLPTSANIGDVIYLYDANARGGVGTLSVVKNAYYNGQSGYESVAIDEEGMYPIFTIEKAGEYVLEYVVTDELGVSQTKTLKVNANYHDKPFIVEPMLLTHAVKGKTIKLPLAKANYVDSTGAYETEVKITVNGVDYTNKDYMVEGDFTVKYTATVKGKDGISNEVSYNVKAIDLVNDPTYFSKYFIFSDIDNDNVNDYLYDIQSGGAQFTTSVSGASAQFVNYMPVQLLNVNFTIPDVNDCIDRFNVYITDSVDKSQSIKLSVVKVENKGVYYPMFAINDQILSTISGSWNVNEKVPFGLSYECDKYNFVDSTGKNLGVVQNYSNGQAFNGFSSGMVYVEIETVLKTEVSVTVVLQEIAGQAFTSKYNEDKGRPQLVVLEDVPTNRFVSVGESFYVPKAFAFDVLSDIKEFSCKIITPSGNITVDKFDGTFRMVAQETGVYIIQYTIKDANDNKMPTQSGEFYIVVRENNVPIVTLEGVKTEYKVGNKLSVPTITVSDDTTDNPIVITYLKDPNNKVITAIKDYEFKIAGKYVLTVYAMDDFSNYTLEQIEIFVE